MIYLLITSIGIVLGALLYKFQKFLNELDGESERNASIINVFFIFLVPIFLVINYVTFDLSSDFYVSSLLTTLLLTESISDIKYGIVLDSLIIVGLCIMIPYRIIVGEFIIYLVGTLILFVVLYCIAAYFYKKTGEIALGGGDIKLYFLIGFFLYPITLFISLNIMSISALIYGLIKRLNTDNVEIRLVPFIFVATILTFYFESAIIDLITY